MGGTTNSATSAPASGAADRSDLDLACRMADAAREVTVPHFASLDFHIESKPDLTPVTEVDRGTERLLRDILRTQRPSDAILGEEYGGELGGARQWVIDPLDSTRNYVRGVPVWATLIALVDHGVPQVGVVDAPALGRRWWAATGHGAWLEVNDDAPRRLTVSGVQRIEDAFVSYSDHAGWGARAAALQEILASSARQRGFGDFWSHCLVAEGGADIAFEPELGLWDMAALIPIVREAGGTITGLDGRDPLLSGSAVSTNTALHDAVLRRLNDAG